MTTISSKRDMAIVSNSGFYCEACLIGRPATEQSPDLRYCQGCYDYLMKEAEMLEGNRSPAWMPKAQKPQERPQKLCRVSGDASPIMSTVNDKKLKWTKFHPDPCLKTKAVANIEIYPKSLSLDLPARAWGVKL